MSSTTLAKKAKKLNISRKSGVRRIVNVSRSRKWENQLRVSQELASKTVLLRTFDRLVFRKTRTLWLFLETDPVILGSKFGKNTHLGLIILSCDSGTSSERQDGVGRTAGLATVFQGGDLSLRLKPQTPLSALWRQQRSVDERLNEVSRRGANSSSTMLCLWPFSSTVYSVWSWPSWRQVMVLMLRQSCW